MNFLEAAFKVLEEAGEPLHYSEIARRALARRILTTQGQTPEATMGSRLYVDTKRPGSRFKRVKRGVFALAEGQPSGIGQRIEAINRQTRVELRRRLMQMPPDRFEALIGELLLALGFDEETVEVTSYGGDGGIDVRGVLNAGGVTEVKAAVQVKRWKRNVQAPVVQALRGSLTVHEQGIIISTSEFSKGAQAEAEAPGKMRISLVDGEKLIELLFEHKIGVTEEQHTVYGLDEEWWGEVAGEGVVAKAVTAPAVGYPLLIRGTQQGHVVEAELLDEAGRVRLNGVEYQSPSGAGKAATGWKAVDGWFFWKYQQPVSGAWRAIDDLRAGKG